MTRLRLYDRYWRLLWDQETSSTSAYQHITGPVFGAIDHQDGRREIREYWRCPEGVKSARLPDKDELRKLLTWPTNPFEYEN